MKVEVEIRGICVNLRGYEIYDEKYKVVYRLNIYLFQARNAKCRIDVRANTSKFDESEKKVNIYLIQRSKDLK